MAFETNDELENLSTWKKVLIGLIPLAVLLVIVELVMSVFYYQRVGNHPLAMIGAYNAAKEWIEYRQVEKQRRIAREKVDRLKLPSGLFEAFFSEEGTNIREHFMALYERDFAQLVGEVNKIGSKLVVFYPAGESDDEKTTFHREFFSILAKKYSVDFVDMGSILRPYSIETISLSPFDPHFSRFGNYLLAVRLKKHLDTLSDYRLGNPLQSDVRVFGDLEPGLDQIWEPKLGVPYRVKANKYGFRMDYDFPIETSKQKILILGDSASFGPYLPGHDTFPAILDRMIPEATVMNGGISGYTITSELSQFSDKAKYVNPDIVVLEVIGNDLTDLFFFKRNIFNRDGKVIAPSLTENQFIEAVRIKQMP